MCSRQVRGFRFGLQFARIQSSLADASLLRYKLQIVCCSSAGSRRLSHVRMLRLSTSTRSGAKTFSVEQAWRLQYSRQRCSARKCTRLAQAQGTSMTRKRCFVVQCVRLPQRQRWKNRRTQTKLHSLAAKSPYRILESWSLQFQQSNFSDWSALVAVLCIWSADTLEREDCRGVES
jgi:hypothetical protein